MYSSFPTENEFPPPHLQNTCVTTADKCPIQTEFMCWRIQGHRTTPDTKAGTWCYLFSGRDSFSRWRYPGFMIADGLLQEGLSASQIFWFQSLAWQVERVRPPQKGLWLSLVSKIHIIFSTERRGKRCLFSHSNSEKIASEHCSSHLKYWLQRTATALKECRRRHPVSSGQLADCNLLLITDDATLPISHPHQHC